MTPVEAFRAAAEMAPSAGEFWREELRGHQEGVQAAPSAVSREVITDAALGFCRQLLRIGVRTLLE